MVLVVVALLGVFLNLFQNLEGQDLNSRTIAIDKNVVGVLGEEVYLRCLYTGQDSIIISSWNRLHSTTSAMKMTGYKYDGKPFSMPGFSTPVSLTNLTVNVKISSLDMESKYACSFSSDYSEIKDTMFLTVVARPVISTHVEEEFLNGTHYQTVSCSASNAKPKAHIHWEIRGAPLSGDVFSIETTSSNHQNVTYNTTSVLSFPILLNNESRVTCVVQHQALTEPRMADITLQTFVSPNISMEMVVQQKDGEHFFQVNCTATGGKPHPDISWILPPSAQTPHKGSESEANTYWFPIDLYEGKNVTCIFGYPLLPGKYTRTVTLPTYYITSLQLKNHSSENGLLILEDGGSDTIISLEVKGNVPSYKINCTKNGESMPKDVDVIGSNILIKGPIGFNLSGQYQCLASYHKHTAGLEFNIEVKQKVLLPATFPPNISVHLWEEAGNIYVECLASNAYPAANVSWVLPQDFNAEIQSNISSSNGLETVRSLLSLPFCVFQELRLECVVDHLDLDGQERRPIFLPVCDPINIILQSNTVWEHGIAYMEVNCSADSTPPAATIELDTDDCRHAINATEFSNVVRVSGSQQGNAVGVWSSAHLSVQAYAGCTVICVLKQQGLQRPERKSLRVPSVGPPESHLGVGPLKDSTLWAAVCEYRGEGVVPNISWVISDHNTTIITASIQPTYDSIKVLVNATYEFHLHQCEGKNLTCLIRNDYGEEERRTATIPKYIISSIVVLNKTIPLRGNHAQRTAVHRIALQKALPDQRIVFRVNGNTPAYHIKCFRADGSAAHTVAGALVFAESVSEHDAGLYTCHASWYHHKATVFFQVDIHSQETQMITFILICFSSASAITLFLFITVCVFCKQSGESRSSNKVRRERESLAGLMQTPYSPEISKPALPAGKGPEYAELVRYSIVIDVKSTV